MFTVTSPKVGVQNWRQKSLPSVNSQVPQGGVGIAMSVRQRKELNKLLRTFDNPKTVKAMAPYAESAQDVTNAIIGELVLRGFPVGPTVVEKIQTGGLMRMWGRFLFDKAAKEESPQLAELATRIATAADANFTRAHELHDLLIKDLKGAIPVDPLAEHGEPPADGAWQCPCGATNPGDVVKCGSCVPDDDAPLGDE